MTTYTSNRDGGKTNEEGHYRFQTKTWSGNVISGMQAVQRSPLAMGINISVGDAKVDMTNYSYTVWIDAVEAVGITTADPSNPRIDRIVGYVDKSVTPSSANSNNPGLLKFMAVAGTPAASPAAPSNVTVQAAVGASNPYFDIANVLVGTGVTTIDNTKITDTRVFISATLANAAVKAQNIDFTTVPKFNVYYNGSASLSGDVKIPFNVKIYDTESGFDNTTNFRYVVSKKGQYNITATTSYNGAFTRVILSLYKNGSPYCRGIDFSTNVTYGNILTTDIDLAVGDYLEIYCSVVSGSGSFNNNPTFGNSFCGHII